MIERQGTTLLALLHRLGPEREARNGGYDFMVSSNPMGGYVLDFPDGGSRYLVGTVVELLLVVGESRALDLGWELW